MVFFLTSSNVKKMKILLTDFKNTAHISPHEYSKAYLMQNSDDKDSKKLKWIIDHFLGILRHEEFLLGVVSHIAKEFNEEEKDYFVIICFSVIFELDPKYNELLYKCLFNLSKILLKTFLLFFGDDDVMKILYEIGTDHFDLEYVTENIIGSLKVWQPIIIEMTETYQSYVKKIENSRLIPLTVPVEPNVLKHKPRDVRAAPSFSVKDETSSPILKSTKKMLTKDVIDEKLNECHKNNKEKANSLLNEVKTIKYRHAQDVPEKTQYIDIKPKPDTVKKLNHKKILNKNVVIKETALTLKRLNKRIQIEEEKEILWLDGLLKSYSNFGNLEEFEEKFRLEQKKERLADIEKKHLLGQLSYEDAIFAKQNLVSENKKKHEEFLKEKQIWYEKIENWKKREEDNNKKIIEKLSLMELNVLEAKSSISIKNKESAEKVKQESEMLRKEALKRKNEELERRCKLIRELNLLALIAKQARVPKIIDLTESSGIGLFCEMSIAELQERLAAMKINIQEELDKKRQLIKDRIIANKEDLENTKKCVQEYLTEKSQLRNEHKKYKEVKLNKLIKELNVDPSQEISDLRKKLQEKRKLRLQTSK